MPISTDDLRRALKDLDALRYGAQDLHSAMRRLVEVTHALFSVDGASLMLVDPDLFLRGVAASDDRVAQFEELEIDHGTGPCTESYQTKELVGSEDLADEPRWGDVPKAAAERGLRAVLVSPIPYGNDAIGVIAVFSSKPHAWSPEGELALIAFTDLAALLIATTMQSEERGELAAQLQRALDARTMIEQAKGVLVARDHVSSRDAFERLRADARRQRRKVVDVAREVLREAGASAGGSTGDAPF
jgi:GAF domain-containing protein